MDTTVASYKTRAKRLGAALDDVFGLKTTHSQRLELIAKEENYPSWDACVGSVAPPSISKAQENSESDSVPPADLSALPKESTKDRASVLPRIFSSISTGVVLLPKNDVANEHLYDLCRQAAQASGRDAVACPNPRVLNLYAPASSEQEQRPVIVLRYWGEEQSHQDRAMLRDVARQALVVVPIGMSTGLSLRKWLEASDIHAVLCARQTSDTAEYALQFANDSLSDAAQARLSRGLKKLGFYPSFNGGRVKVADRGGLTLLGAKSALETSDALTMLSAYFRDQGYRPADVTYGRPCIQRLVAPTQDAQLGSAVTFMENISTSSHVELVRNLLEKGESVVAEMQANSSLGMLARLKALSAENADHYSEICDIAGQRSFTLIYVNMLDKLCQHCATPYREAKHDFSDYERGLVYKSELALLAHLPGAGCEHCKNGFAGKTAIADIIRPDEKFFERLDRLGEREALAYAKKAEGDRDLESIYVRKIAEGAISLLEHPGLR